MMSVAAAGHHQLGAGTPATSKGHYKTNAFSCHLCQKAFNHKFSLTRHQERDHNIDIPRLEKKNIVCGEHNCGFTCGFRKNLISHLENVHGFVFEVQNLVFDSLRDFYQWKSNEEKNTNQTWTSKHTCLYVCNHSVNVKGTKRGHRPRPGNKHCTSTMTLKQIDGKVTLSYIKTHYNHYGDTHTMASNFNGMTGSAFSMPAGSTNNHYYNQGQNFGSQVKSSLQALTMLEGTHDVKQLKEECMRSIQTVNNLDALKKIRKCIHSFQIATMTNNHTFQ